MAKKDGIKVNFNIEKSVNSKLTDFCIKTGRTKTKVIELAIIKYIEEHKSEM